MRDLVTTAAAGAVPSAAARRSARWALGGAVDLERAAEHADTLADPDEPEAPALRCPGERTFDLEARAVVGDTHLDGRASRAHADVDREAPLCSRMFDSASWIARNTATRCAELSDSASPRISR